MKAFRGCCTPRGTHSAHAPFNTLQIVCSVCVCGGGEGTQGLCPSPNLNGNTTPQCLSSGGRLGRVLRGLRGSSPHSSPQGADCLLGRVLGGLRHGPDPMQQPSPQCPSPQRRLHQWGGHCRGSPELARPMWVCVPEISYPWFLPWVHPGYTCKRCAPLCHLR